MDQDIVHNLVGSLIIDKHNANVLGKENVAEGLMALSQDFEDWFKRNHTVQEKVDWETQTPYVQYQRTYAWSVIRPRENKYYDSTTITKADGTTEEIPVLPSLKYFKRLVKDEYKTQKVEGVTVDNRGYWLPKTVAQGARDDRYINKDYQRLKTTNPDRYELLESIKKIHLKNQQGLNKKAKLYLDFPRYRKQTVERLRNSNPIERILQRIKDFWSKVKDSWDQGFNYEENLNLVKIDMFDDEINSVPIAGLSNLDIDEVSTDVIYTTMRYMLSAERNKGLNKIAPVARMIQNVVNNEKNYPLDSKLLNNTTIINMNKKKDRYLRAKAVNNFVEKTFEGKVNVGFGAENPIVQNVSNAIFKRASSAFLDLNIPSALKNALGAKFQGMIEAVAGKYMTMRDYTAAEPWAVHTAFTISSEIYKQGPKSRDVQLVELFDPERDRFNHHFGESITRTKSKDYSFLLLNRMTDFRRWTQLQASLQIFGAMMKHQKIQTADGKTISYDEAWEVKDGKIQLKSNVPAEWGITYDSDGNQLVGEKYLQKRNEMQRVIDNLNGSMGKEDRPEADRYLLYRYISFFRRFLTSMLTNRFAYSGSLLAGTSRGRFDYSLGDTKEGFYITFVKSLKNAFETGFNSWLIVPLVFGFDGDDEDKYKKLRANSDALPLPLVFDDPKRPFNITGWMGNHALLQTMQVAGENDQFLPFPGYGINNYKDFLDIKSMAFGPTLKTGFDIINDVGYIVTGDEKARYQRSAGPYIWQQEGELKLWSHIAKSFGMTGTNVDPAKAIRNYQSIENR
jgi:hypothetical protein